MLFELLVEWTGIDRKIKDKKEVNRIINEVVALSMAPYVSASVGTGVLRRGGGKTRRIKRTRGRASNKRASSRS